VAAIKTFQPMSKREIAAVLARTGKGPTGKKVEEYKTWTDPKGAHVHPLHRDGEDA
jgi:hypothetical protein